MFPAVRGALLATLSLMALPALGQTHAGTRTDAARPAESAARASDAHIYQQRLSDGRTVLTDRPVDGARTQRTWQITREDEAAARERSERVRLEAQAVSERVQRRIDEQQSQADAFERERLRASLAEARRDADIARENARETPVLFFPAASPGPIHRRPPHLGARSGPNVRPKPGVRPRPVPPPAAPRVGAPQPRDPL